MHRTQSANEPKQVLPTVRLAHGIYVIDLRLRQFRDTMVPSKRVDFDPVQGGPMCRQAGVVTCLSCGMSVIIPVGVDDNALSCARRGRRLAREDGEVFLDILKRIEGCSNARTGVEPAVYFRTSQVARIRVQKCRISWRIAPVRTSADFGSFVNMRIDRGFSTPTNTRA